MFKRSSALPTSPALFLFPLTFLRALTFTLLVSLALSFITYANAAVNNDLPTRSEVQNQFDALSKQKSLTPVEKLSQQDLVHTLEYLDALERVKQDAAQLRQQVTDAPVKLRTASDGLDKLKNGGNDGVTKESLATLSLRQLENRLNDTLDDLQSSQEDLSTFNTQLISLQTQPERVQGAMYNYSLAIQKVRNQLNGMAPGQQDLRATQQTMLVTEQALLNAQIDYQRKSLEANTTLQDLLQKQRDFTNAHINQLERVAQMLQEVVNGKRLTLSERTAKEAQTPDDTSNIQNDPLVAQELGINRTLSQRLIAATEEGNQLVQKNITVKNWLDRSSQAEHDLKEQISVLKGSLLLSRILYQQQQNTIPPSGLMTDMSAKIADLRLEQFTINQQRDALFQGDSYIQGVVNNSKEKINDDISDALDQIVDMRRELLDQLNKQLGNQLSLAINLQINQQQLLSINESLTQTLTQQIFWVSSNKPMNWDFIKTLPSEVKSQLSELRIKMPLGELMMGGLHSLPVNVPLLVVILVLLLRRRALQRHLDKLNSDVGQLKRDTQLHTPRALMIIMLSTLPGVLLTLGIGYWFSQCDIELSDFLWALSQRLAVFMLVMGFCFRLLKPNGVSEKHFNTSPAQCAHYRRSVVRLVLVMLPLIFWSVRGEKAPLGLVDDIIGQVVILLTLIALAVLVFPIFRDSWREKNTHSVRLVIVAAIAIAPLLLVGLMVAGYFYTTLRLAGRWIDSFYLLILWNITYLSALRGLSVAARRLAYRRALARRQSINAKEGAEGSEPVEETPLGLDQINQQSLRLTTMVLFFIFASVFYWIWSDLLTVISYLDSISLWHYSSNVAGSVVQQTVTLGNLLLAFVAVIVAYVLTRNLPGLLEVVVLSRLQLRQGTSYAITTIMTYSITVIGTVTALGSLGVSWDKLQWLVAALSVGLGFGLQEIFANFVSGLIILFERPVRIGDTVTIGTFSGTVSRIRIRATTIIDFDRKEVIIPNKAFVTERLINWSLSDTVTRIIIKVGVAYGSDLDKVKEILLQAAHESSRVMSDPAPLVYFLNFGASTLDHELRVYVRELGDRSHTVDELNRTIDRLCRENDINIAFNQLEVYLHDKNGGEEVQEVKRELRQPGEPLPPEAI
ncbi:MAG: mechanosensitive channel MscK [Ewingella americana]|jgi:potassium efflux system protein|uniref:mechanosensitive channel MscK n=1 Tax=Ewingella americana TaxID=41202 RepID=UPI00242AE39C|nr:mechanosensitive channel MscK [Ewingella americana]MCI1677383.1 mechanosensitive channel MscK [Ewingella americana]MCI1852928.1 mechanosensitive channel MscK [Ewingella americana]MCI1860986.1 mechanosensitive channel MscK [Ewingella americana]MCI2142386.1 mechanosensitive channel MscK [Ewingella americana]MCI2163572.1 mechanosensitive channel MscK [Ewingella americana]